LGEFEDVGNIIRDFSDEDATVIVGSVFDPELTDSLRVTVVATGLQEPGEKRTPMSVVVDNPPRTSRGDVDFDSLGQPTVTRRGQGAAQSAARKVDLNADQEFDYLDVPAFLRNQAD
jgi:cell division protein FtsZ